MTDTRSAAAAPVGGASGSTPIAHARYHPTEIDLFMFCAATWNTHRIHYDRDYARSEGYRDLVVAGPIQSARLAQMLADFATSRHGRLATLDVRHRTIAFCGEPLDLRADVTDVTRADSLTTVRVSVRATNPAGVVTTAGAGTLEFTGESARAAWIA
jgi:hydroxyacyl-ACP dehydratase HTD2-like protein with hotdog domain